LTILILAAHRSNERKHGLYPTTLEHHEHLGIDFYLHMIGNKPTQGPYKELRSKWLANSSKRSLPHLRLDAFFFASIRYHKDLSIIREHILTAGKPKLILALTSSPISGTVAYLAAREHKIPFVVWEHLTHYQRKMLHGMRLKRRIEIMKSADTILAVSKSLGSSIESTLGIKRNKVEIMPNPIPKDFIGNLPDITRNYLDASQDTFTFGAWTNWRKIKRLDILLEAFSHVHAEYPNTALLVAGPIAKNVYSNIKQPLLKQPGLTLLDSVSRREILDLARQVYCCVIPSDHETFGLPALEAMALGKPVITTRSGGPEHLVTDANGIITERGSAFSIAKAMVEVLKNHHKYNPAIISRIAHESYGPEAMVSRWEQVYGKFGIVSEHTPVKNMLQ